MWPLWDCPCGIIHQDGDAFIQQALKKTEQTRQCGRHLFAGWTPEKLCGHASFVQFIYCEAHDVIACKQCYHAEESKVAIILRQEKV